ncbi:MAG: aspartate aminotransferase family protein [Geminicoccaceae bacterium]|nr:aspartate aminotransferase family protein [Geminicoccaceae bacterium]
MRNAAVPTLLPVYNRIDLTFVRGEGSWLIDTQGRRYLDFGSGIAVTGLGHCHPHLVRTLQEQAGKLWHTSNLYRIAEQERLADRLVANSFAETVFVCNSGAEAIEGCIKLVRRYWWAKGRPERVEIVTFEGAFHGRTMAAISAAGSKKLTEGCGPLLPGFRILPFGDHDALERAIGPDTAAVLVEPIQGEGGIRPIPSSCLRSLRELCDRHGALLVLDEVQCGMGRTGRLFAHEAMGVRPDVVAIAKGLGGGFPIGAFLATAEAASGMTAGAHGSTFGGNPLACAVANAVLDVMLAEGFLDRVKAVGAYAERRIRETAAALPEAIAEVRGTGLMLGIKTVRPNTEVATLLREAGLLTVPAADNVLRLLPPLTVSEEEIERACAIIGETLRARAA